MSLVIRALAVLAVAGPLAACGTSTTDRTITGAGIGAGTGAAIGAIFGGIGALPGALIGAGVGGVSGAVTSEEDVNLGKPAWDY